MSVLPPADIEHVLAHTTEVWPRLKGKRLFFTGATGFFGIWMLGTWAEANRRYNLGMHVTALSRDPTAFARKIPSLGEGEPITWVTGSPLTFTAQDLAKTWGRTPAFDAVVHLATESDLQAAPEAATAVIVNSTRAALAVAADTGAKRFLFTSSGVVQTSSSRYGVGAAAKRRAEELCEAFAARHQADVTIARCYSFLGPWLPLDGKFAAGNFIRDALEGRDIVIQGDGTPVRSYLYAADLAIWLWRMVATSEGTGLRTYDVGAETPVSIAELANAVAEAAGSSLRVQIRDSMPKTGAEDRYVPSTVAAREAFGVREWISLPNALRRTLAWEQERRKGRSGEYD